MSENYLDPVRRDWTSASNAPADALCSGRYLAQKGLAETGAREYAETGRRIHAALAKRTTEGLAGGELDSYSACIAVEQLVLERVFAGQPLSQIGTKAHHRFWYKFALENGQIVEHSGEADRWYRLAGAGLILDYKVLPGDVEAAPSNLQLRDLAVLASKELVLDTVTCAIIQPLVTGNNPELCTYYRPDLRQAEREMRERITASHLRPVRVPGDVQCKFCKAKQQGCLEYQHWAGAMLPAMLTLLDVPVAHWTPEQRAQFCTRRLVAQKWLDETLEAMETLELATPGSIPGFAMKPGNKVKTITLPETVYSRFLAMGGTHEAFMATVKLTQKTLKEALRSLTQSSGKALDNEVRRLIEGCYTESENKPSLAPKNEHEK